MSSLSDLVLEDYNVSKNGFLPEQAPLRVLPDPYYAPWEAVLGDLPAAIQARRIRKDIDSLPVLSTSRLGSEKEWQRAYSVLSFMTHAYIWGGERPSERLPAAITCPFLKVSQHLGLPPTATYAALNLWNWVPVTPGADIRVPENIQMLHTFTGTKDEEWFYLISIAIEACGASILPAMTKAMKAATEHDTETVEEGLREFTRCVEELGVILERMYEKCAPDVFYNQIRPFLAGSKNMAVAGLLKGVFYEEAEGKGEWRQYSGGSNAQSSLIQFLDVVLGVEHRATGEVGAAPKAKHPFLQGMRDYMPGRHRAFLEHLTAHSNIRSFVLAHSPEHSLTTTYNKAVMTLSGFRDKHIQIVTRYVITPARNAAMRKPLAEHTNVLNLAVASSRSSSPDKKATGEGLYGTGGTQLLPFLKQSRDETRNMARN